MTLRDEILALKRERGAVILAHNYQVDEVQAIADFTGDSLELARKATNLQSDLVVFCGVYFMAETAAILNPGKKVLIPDPDAGCPMADMITGEQLRAFKAKHPGAKVLCYVNSTAEVKAESDCCVTSANALNYNVNADASCSKEAGKTGVGAGIAVAVNGADTYAAVNDKAKLSGVLAGGLSVTAAQTLH